MGKGANGKRHFWRGKGGSGKLASQGGQARRDFDLDELSQLLFSLPSCDPDTAAKTTTKLYNTLTKQTFDTFLASASADNDVRQQFQSALEAGLPCFSKLQRAKIIEKFGVHGFELQDFSSHIRDRGRKAGRGTGSRRKGGGREPYQEVGKDGRSTGANTIEVSWNPPENSSVDGVTAKSAPAKPASLPPVVRPAGRGRSTVQPAWMTQTPAAVMPALPDLAIGKGTETASASSAQNGAASASTLCPKSDQYTMGNEDRPEVDKFGAIWRETRSEVAHRGKEAESRAWQWNKNTERTRSRSRSRHGSNNDERGAAGDRGETEKRWDKKAWRTAWKQRSGGGWDRSSWRDRWNSRQSWQGGREVHPTFCAKHNAKRSWIRLVEDADGHWVCQPGDECVIVLGGVCSESSAACAIDGRSSSKSMSQNDVESSEGGRGGAALPSVEDASGGNKLSLALQLPPPPPPPISQPQQSQQPQQQPQSQRQQKQHQAQHVQIPHQPQEPLAMHGVMTPMTLGAFLPPMHMAQTMSPVPHTLPMPMPVLCQVPTAVEAANQQLLSRAQMQALMQGSTQTSQTVQIDAEDL